MGEPTLHEVAGYLWCDHEGAIHDDDPDPYDYGHGDWDGTDQWEPYVCPGPHRVLWIRPEADDE